MNLSSNINLLRLPKAAVMNVGGEPCVVIPVKRNDIYLTADEAGRPKGAFLSFAQFELKEVSKYGDSHMIKQSHSKEWNAAHTDDERKAEPIIGNTKPMTKEVKAEALPKADVQGEPVNWDTMQNDLPFPPAEQ